jgi:predicted phage terminase large subunit-like protein
MISFDEALAEIALSDPCGPALSGFTPDEWQKALDAAAMAADLKTFVKAFWRVGDPNEPFVEGWCVDAIIDHLMAVTDGTIKRLLINVPPGFTKSFLCDVFWPAWEWGPAERPWYRYVCTAYNATLTMRDNGRFRRVLLDPAYYALWGQDFVLTAIGSKRIENSRTGFKLATSVGGVTTGERGNRVVIDDPNNPKEIESDAVREGTNLWMREIVPDRLNNMKRDAIICIQQRTHQKDVSGTILDVFGEEYTHLMIPMEYEPERHCVTVLGWEDPRGLDDTGNRLEGFVEDADGNLTGQIVPGSAVDLRRGRLAWPARFPMDVVESLRKKGPYAYSGQYMQSPTPRGGNLIQRRWWLPWENEKFPDFGTVAVSLDTAIKEGEENDWNALTAWGAFANEEDESPRLMLRAAKRMRGSLSELAMVAGQMCKEVGAEVLLIEDKTRGHDCAAEIQRLFADATWTTILVPPAGDKISRVIACQPFWSGDVMTRDDLTGITTWTGGVIYAPNKTWAEEVIEECEQFPRGEWDDYVDSCTQALLWMRVNGVVVRPVEHRAAELEARKLERLKPRKSIYDV